MFCDRCDKYCLKEEWIYISELDVWQHMKIVRLMSIDGIIDSTCGRIPYGRIPRIV